jgi:hypothetical protein
MRITSLALVAAALLSADAFAPMVSRSSPMTRALQMAASDKPLTELCEITKEACDAVSPMLNGEWM